MISNNKYVYLVCPKEECYTNPAWEAVYFVVAKDDDECWKMLYEDHYNDPFSIKWLKEEYEIKAKFPVATNTPSEILWGKQRA